MAGADSRNPATTRAPASPGAGDAIRIGRIAGAHGLKGALRLRLDNPESDTLAGVRRVSVELNGASRDYAIVSVGRGGQGMLRVALEGVADVNAADALRGGVVAVATRDLPPTKPGEFYYHEIVGCEVFATDGRRIGTIEEVFATGANDVWVVREREREVLVPVIEDVVKSIDLAARRIVIEAVPGLLDG